MDAFAAVAPGKREARPLVIGLVNNMSASGMAATYQQFSSALAESGYKVELRHLTLKEGDAAMDCAQVDAVPEDEVDAYIVTGMEPKTGDLREEYIWPRLTKLYDRCEERAIPVIWSCLAAHAAVLHGHKIPRRRHDAKLSGVFNCTRTAVTHTLLEAMPEQWSCPHSRHNGLAEEALLAAGYAVLSRAEAAGVDIFTRADGTPFFYFQGHPEYGQDTLLREYLRDARRFHTGESTTFPAVPKGYLHPEDEQALLGFTAGMRWTRGNEHRFTPRVTWLEARRRLFKNWMEIVAAHAGKLVPAFDMLMAYEGCAQSRRERGREFGKTNAA